MSKTTSAARRFAASKSEAIQTFAEVITNAFAVEENAALHWFRKLEGPETGCAWGEHGNRLNEYLAAHHGLTPKQIGELTFADMARIFKGDYEKRLAESSANAKQNSRLRFDSHTLTVYLDENPIAVSKPKAFELYKIIAEHLGPITRREIRQKSRHFRGDKTIPKFRDLLPPALRRTIKSDNTGYWLQLPSAKQIRT